MHALRRLYCRAFQKAFHVAIPLLPYREPKILHEPEQLARVFRAHGIGSVLLVTDPGIARIGLADRTLEVLSEAGIDCPVYDGTVPNPTLDNIEEAAALYRERRCSAVIGFGGGSSIDCAKGVAIRIAKPNKDLRRLSGILKVHARLPMLVAVPTTAGTGSEVTVAAVITDADTHHKFPINDFCIIPRYAMHDYHVTLGLPRQVTSTTGMDTLTHAVEAYIGRSTTRYTRQKAENAVQLVHRYLYRAYLDGDDAEARAKMQVAAYDAGIAFTQSYVGYVHGLAHSLGGRYGVPHGLANAVILPYFLREYGSAVEPRLARLARLCGMCDDSASDALAAGKFVEWVEQMNEQMDIPRYIDGIDPADVPAMAAHADAESNPLYPVPVLMDAAELERMYYVVGGLAVPGSEEVHDAAEGDPGDGREAA